METSKKRALEDIERKSITLSSKRRRQDQASDPNPITHATTTSNPSIATSSPTLIGSPARTTPTQSLQTSTPSYSSSVTSSEASESSNDASSSSSEGTNSADYASTSSADSTPPQPHSHLPSLLPRMISPSTTTTSSGTSTDSGSYNSASISDDVSSFVSSSSAASPSTTTTSSSESTSESISDSISSTASSSGSSSSSSADSSLSSAHASQPPPLCVASLTADNLSHLQARLNALLPKIKSANAVLETEREAGRLEERDIENVGEGEKGGYIEMDLGLGVLEEKREDGGRGCEGGEDESEGVGDVLGDLMGERRRGEGKRGVGIEEVRS